MNFVENYEAVTVDFRDFIAKMQNPPPFMVLMSQAPPDPNFRWMEEDLLPIKTEQELLRENIHKEWNW